MFTLTCGAFAARGYLSRGRRVIWRPVTGRAAKSPCPRLVRDPSGLVAYADGRPIRPEYLTHRFRQIRKDLGLPPILLHDLPHGAAPARWPPAPT